MIGYLDLPSGLSGDMLLGCLIDSGWPIAQLEQTLSRLALPAGEWAVQVAQVRKGSLRAARVDVLAEEGRHDRRLADVRAIIDSSDLPPIVRERATAVFVRLAEAEAKVHGTPVDQVHFHEVGAVDSIIDIVGAVAGLHDLTIDQLYASAVPLGQGWAQTAHGKLPLPAPATLELLAAAGAPTRPAPGPGELLTPTGAAILCEMATFQQPEMSIRRVGVGAGQKDFPWPNIARLWLGEAEAHGPLVQLETNIDDMNPQLYAAVSDKLFAAGARDVWIIPVQMKKGRPGVVLSVLGMAGDESALADIILRETTTLGVRVLAVPRRHEARREMGEVMTPFGPIKAKTKWLGSEPAGVTPEFDDCRRIAESAGVAVRTVHDAAVAASHALLATLRDGSPTDRL
ncbi:MAG: hypothetical protein JWL69_667 [Phycisphaerales bacterium]|nr:hypothetical protein [Phycisphaerales bacterium]